MQRVIVMMQRYIVAVIGLGLLAVALSVVAVQAGTHQAAVSDNEQRIEQLTQERNDAQQTLDAAQEELYEQITGSEAPRLAQDTRDLATMVETMVTWDDHESYVDARETVIEDYGITNESFTTLFPEAPVTVDGEGNEYYYIDSADLNGQLGDYSVELLQVNGSDYSYVVFADMVTESVVGTVTSTSEVPIILFATVTRDGDMLDVRGYAGSDIVRSSSS